MQVQLKQTNHELEVGTAAELVSVCSVDSATGFTSDTAGADTLVDGSGARTPIPDAPAAAKGMAEAWVTLGWIEGRDVTLVRGAARSEAGMI